MTTYKRSNSMTPTPTTEQECKCDLAHVPARTPICDEYWTMCHRGDGCIDCGHSEKCHAPPTIPVDLPKVGEVAILQAYCDAECDPCTYGSFEAGYTAGLKAGQSSTSFRAGAEWMREQVISECEIVATNYRTAPTRNDYYSCDDSCEETATDLIITIRAINIDAIAQSGEKGNG